MNNSSLFVFFIFPISYPRTTQQDVPPYSRIYTYTIDTINSDMIIIMQVIIKIKSTSSNHLNGRQDLSNLPGPVIESPAPIASWSRGRPNNLLHYRRVIANETVAT